MMGVSTRVLVSLTIVVSAVGALDSTIGREWDLLVVFLLSLSLQLVLWLRERANRTPVTIRPDLARWLERHSSRTGEPYDDVLDRAIAWYRDGLFAPDRIDEGGR
ncbi:MAG: hypothetical protein AAFN30_08570, partial [Actinomycetota bacterium]